MTSWKHQSLRFQLQKRATLPQHPLHHKQRKASRVGSFSMCKVPNFACQLHEVTFYFHFQRQSGSINRPVSSCRRGRRCLVAARLPCLGFAGGQKVVAVFSNLAAVINYLPFISLARSAFSRGTFSTFHISVCCRFLHHFFGFNARRYITVGA